MNFRERLRELRAENAFTQKELAEKLNISKNTICEWEKGRCEPSIQNLEKMSIIFKCSIGYLVGSEDDFGIVQSQSAAPSLDKDEQELIENFRELNRLQKQKILAYTEGMLAAERQYTKK